WPVGRKAEGLAPAPRKSGDCDFAVGGRQLGHIVIRGVQISSDLLWRQLADGLADCAAIRELARAAAVRPHAREQIGGDGDVAGFGQDGLDSARRDRRRWTPAPNPGRRTGPRVFRLAYAWSGKAATKFGSSRSPANL